MQIIIYIIPAVLFLGGLFLFWLPQGFQRDSQAPLQDAWAILKARGIRKGKRSRKGFPYLLTFVTDSGETLELYAREQAYNALQEGMEGKLVWQGRYFMGFAPRGK